MNCVIRGRAGRSYGVCGSRVTRSPETTRDRTWRAIAPPEPVEFVDELCGPQRVDVDRQVGDFIVATKAGLPAYQLAVVVDDARQGVTDVVRGDDLLTSAARQLWLYRLLRLTPRRVITICRWCSAPTAAGWPSVTATRGSPSTVSAACRRSGWSACSRRGAGSKAGGGR